MEIRTIIRNAHGYECLSCGRCTGACPITATSPDFSPRTLIERALLDGTDRLLERQDHWKCLTCGACLDKCDHRVDFTAIIRELRRAAFEGMKRPHYSHGEILQTIMRMSLDAAPASAPATSEYYYFRGCQRYFEWMSESDTGPLHIEDSVLAILRRLGITPMVPETDVCCGHDLLWLGDMKNYESLARKTIERIAASGAKYVVTSCPECLYTFRVEYPAHFGRLPFTPLHWTEVLVVKEKMGTLTFSEGGAQQRVTYHDSCRMGRFLNVYEEPRRLLSSMGSTELVEMRKSRSKALCCGTSGWIECDAAAKERQAALLREAARTGAGTLLTSCPKCLMHVRCAISHGLSPELEALEVMDISTYVAERLAQEAPAHATQEPDAPTVVSAAHSPLTVTAGAAAAQAPVHAAASPGQDIARTAAQAPVPAAASPGEDIARTPAQAPVHAAATPGEDRARTAATLKALTAAPRTKKAAKRKPEPPPGAGGGKTGKAGGEDTLLLDYL